MKKKQIEHSELHNKKSDAIAELKSVTTTLLDQNSRLDAKLDKTKGNLQEDILRTKTDISEKLDVNDRYYLD